MRNSAARMPAALAAIASLALPNAAAAGEVSDAVRPFYEHPGLELEASARDRFIDPARRVLDLDEAIRKTGEVGCLDPALPFDDTDYDLAEVTGSLSLTETVSGDRAKVVASFKVPDSMARVEWKLKKVGGEWKIADIVSQTKDWALSQFNCE